MTQKTLPIALVTLVAFGAAACRQDSAIDPTGPVEQPANRSGSADRGTEQRSARTPQAPGAGAGAATTGTHCGAGEAVLFSCTIEGSDRVVSLCAADEGTREPVVRYAAGPLRAPDIVFPDAASGMPGFRRTTLTLAGGSGGYAYSFERADAAHVIYSISGENPLERHGHLLTDTEFAEAEEDHPCSAGSVVQSDDLDLLRQVRTWPEQPELARRGLPPVSP